MSEQWRSAAGKASGDVRSRALAAADEIAVAHADALDRLGGSTTRRAVRDVSLR